MVGYAEGIFYVKLLFMIISNQFYCKYTVLGLLIQGLFVFIVYTLLMTLSLPCFSVQMKHVKFAKTWTLFSNNVNTTIRKYSSRAFIWVVTPLGFVGHFRIEKFSWFNQIHLCQFLGPRGFLSPRRDKIRKRKKRREPTSGSGRCESHCLAKIGVSQHHEID